MRVLVLHNRYQQCGGEDGAAEQDVALLRKHGHAVHFHTIHNDEIKRYSTFQKASLWFRPTWSMKSHREVRLIIKAFRPDVIHVHNFFPLLSPSVYFAARDCGVPVVQTLHNYRVLAPCALLMRENRVCERCIEGSLWNSIRYRCYHGSTMQTASIAAMIAMHRWCGTWGTLVDKFIALTEFSKGLFVRAGLPEAKITVRPNFLLEDPGTWSGKRSGVIFVGRVSEEKGIVCLLNAWRSLPDVPLTIIGDGPLREWAAEYISRNDLRLVRLLGMQSSSRIFEELKRSAFLVFPSIWYETFGRTVVEAFATGTPVLVSDIGAGGSLVEENVTGRHFEPGSPYDLASKALEMARDPDKLRDWGANARQEYLGKYSAGNAYESLMRVYQGVAGGKS